MASSDSSRRSYQVCTSGQCYAPGMKHFYLYGQTFIYYNKITFIIIRSLFARQGSFLHRKWHSFDELCKKNIYNFRGCHDTRKEYFAFPFPFRLEIIPSLIHACEIPKISIYFYLNRNMYIPLIKNINILRGKYCLTLYLSYMLIANVA